MMSFQIDMSFMKRVIQAMTLISSFLLKIMLSTMVGRVDIDDAISLLDPDAGIQEQCWRSDE